MSSNSIASQDSIPNHPPEIRSKSQALNYCLVVCRKSLREIGCAKNCAIRKRWRIPPHGEKYYGED